MSDGIFESREDFRIHSTTEDVMELFEFYIKYRKGLEYFPTKKEPNPECRFQFSADEARQVLSEFYLSDEEGFILMGAIYFIEDILFIDSNTKKNPHLKFLEKKQKFTKRSVMMTEDHWHRLQKLYDMYPTMNKHYVFQAFLEDAFARLGV